MHFLNNVNNHIFLLSYSQKNSNFSHIYEGLFILKSNIYNGIFINLKISLPYVKYFENLQEDKFRGKKYK